MDISRKLGILVFFGIPAIIGGGIVYAIFGSYPPVAIYEILSASLSDFSVNSDPFSMGYRAPVQVIPYPISS
jgi:hypothetical protein